MSTKLSISCSVTGAKSGAVPLICAPSPMRYYRRSTTTKAPRKRTFLLTMTKYSVELTTLPGVASAFANNVAMISGGVCYEGEPALLGGDGNSGFGGNNGGNKDNNNSNSGGSADNDGGFLWRIAPTLGHAILGAFAIIITVAIFPSQSVAMPQGSSSPPYAYNFLGGSPKDARLLSASAPNGRSAAGPLADVPAFGRSSSPTPSRPRSKVLHVPCKGSTMVVPLTGTIDIKNAAPRLGPWQRAKVVDAPIVLSGNEAAVLDLPQYRVRESMLV